MSTLAIPISARPIIYPDSDGKPMAENTLQYDWIVKITGGLRRIFANDPKVFVAGDLFWYPVEGRPDIRIAPDVLVVFGRPPGHRMSYRQWEEDRIAPQVVFEVLSPSNRVGEMSSKFDFYRRYGVEEYYIYDPDPNSLELSGFVRQKDDLIEVQPMHGHMSPRLKVTFEMGADGLQLIGPDGRPFGTFEEVARAEIQARQLAADQQLRAQEAEQRADQERNRADQERNRAEQEHGRAEQERHRADRLQAELDRLRRETTRDKR
jgi:Uma2 family endonuclease